MSQDEEVLSGHSLTAYARLVARYPGWRILWIGEMLSSLGNWFGFVATLLLVERLAAGRGILLSVVLIMRFIPSFILFPIAGVFADRYNRVNILIYSCVISAIAGAMLPVIQRPQELWLLYTLLFLEFSASAFYDPARRALTPALVPRNLLHLATTIDSFAWSLTGALGASLGGLAASKLSVNACFLLDAVTYLVAAACNYRLRMLVPPDQMKAACKSTGPDPGEMDPEVAEVAKPNRSSLEKEASLENGNSSRSLELQRPSLDSKHSSSSKAFLSEPLNSRSGLDSQQSADDESAALLGPEQVVQGGDATGQNSGEGAPPPGGCLALITFGMKDGLVSMNEGWSYVCNASNWDVLLLTLLKAGGSLVWGAADVLNVRFAELPEMQSLGDSALTLGLFFASVGFACLIGPIIFNVFTPPKAPNLLLSSTFCYLWLLAGYIGMTMASNVYWMCLSIMVKSFGSSVMWVYSTLLLQLRVPDAMLGRMMALEMAFFTVAESTSGLFGGVALDDLGLGIRQVSALMAGVAAVISCIWLPYALRKFAKAKSLTTAVVQM